MWYGDPQQNGVCEGGEERGFFLQGGKLCAAAPRQPQLHDKTIRQCGPGSLRGGRIPRFAYCRPDCAWKKASCAMNNFATDHSQ
jgi:hypothetical protein